MSIVTTLEYGRYKICLNPAPFLSEEHRAAVADSEITIYDPADNPVLVADARGSQIQMQRWAENEIDRLLPCCPCSDEQPVKPGYKLCWDCLDCAVAHGIDERLYHA